MRAVVAVLLSLFWCVHTSWALGQKGVSPESTWRCPPDHPIKATFTDPSGNPCVYHVPRGGRYGRVSPERCYVSETEAREDGCIKSRW